MSEQTQTLIGGKTVSEKYTVDSSEGGLFVIWDDIEEEVYLDLIPNKSKADHICRLLNDNEKRKSLPKIDKKFKEWANNELKLTIAHRSMYIDKEQWDENIRNLERLLNIVNSLEIQQ